MKLDPAKLRDRFVAMRRDREGHLVKAREDRSLGRGPSEIVFTCVHREIVLLNQLCDALDASMESDA